MSEQQVKTLYATVLRSELEELRARASGAVGVPVPGLAEAPSRVEAVIVAIRDLWDEDECPAYPVVADALRKFLSAAPSVQPAAELKYTEDEMLKAQQEMYALGMRQSAEQSAPSEVEEVEVVAWVYTDTSPEEYLRTNPFVVFARPDGSAPGPATHDHEQREPLMTAAQHKRIVAQLANRDAGVVRVPVEWHEAVKELFDAKQALKDFEEANPHDSTKRWDACLQRIEDAEDKLRALLAQRDQRGGDDACR